MCCGFRTVLAHGYLKSIKRAYGPTEKSIEGSVGSFENKICPDVRLFGTDLHG